MQKWVTVTDSWVQLNQGSDRGCMQSIFFFTFFETFVDFFSFSFFWLHCVAYRVLVLPLGNLVLEPMPPVVKAWILNHWPTREVPSM